MIRKLENWNEKTARLFAADCAEHTLRFFEKNNPNDDRPRRAIQTARDFANGKINVEELAAARDAARDAARAAERKWQLKKLAEYLGINQFAK